MSKKQNYVHPYKTVFSLNPLKAIKRGIELWTLRKVEIVVLGDSKEINRLLCYSFLSKDYKNIINMDVIPEFGIQSKTYGKGVLKVEVNLICYENGNIDMNDDSLRLYFVTFDLNERKSFEGVRKWVDLIKEKALKNTYYLIIGVDKSERKNKKKKSRKKRKFYKVHKKEASDLSKELNSTFYLEMIVRNTHHSIKKIRLKFFGLIDFAICAISHTKSKYLEEKKKAEKREKEKLYTVLKSLKLEEYFENFQDERVIYQDLKHFSDEDLELLLPKEIPRKRLKRYIETEFDTSIKSERRRSSGSYSSSSSDGDEGLKQFEKELLSNITEYEKKDWHIPPNCVTQKKLLNTGAFGVVSLADLKIGYITEVVAVKKVLVKSEEEKNNVIHEIEIMSELENEYVCKCFGGFVEEKAVNIVMQFCNQGHLGEYIKGKPFKKKLDCLIQITKGMNFIHSKGIIHRDLKPKNIIIHDDKIKIADYGASKHEETAGESFVGSLNYMGPEFFNSDLRADNHSKKTDVYSFAIICWECLSETEAFNDIKSNSQFQKFISIHKQKIRPDISSLNISGVKGENELKKLILKCWSERQSERPDFDEICSELEKIYALN